MQSIDSDYLFAKGREYREVIDKALRDGGGSNRKGVTTLARTLSVHTTFISKVMLGKADFSAEQAVRFAAGVGMTAEESEFFLDLVCRDRAGDAATRQHYERKLQRQREARQDLRRRLQSQRDLTLQDQALYYESWLPQAVHVLSHAPGPHTPTTLAKRLNVKSLAVADAIDKLVAIGLLAKTSSGLQPTVAFVHTGKDSPHVRRLHINWRQKVIADFLCDGAGDGLHFSAAACIDEPTAHQIRALLVDALASTKQAVAAAPNRDLYVIGLDFYKL